MVALPGRISAKGAEIIIINSESILLGA